MQRQSSFQGRPVWTSQPPQLANWFALCSPLLSSTPIVYPYETITYLREHPHDGRDLCRVNPGERRRGWKAPGEMEEAEARAGEGDCCFITTGQEIRPPISTRVRGLCLCVYVPEEEERVEEREGGGVYAGRRRGAGVHLLSAKARPFFIFFLLSLPTLSTLLS